MADKVI